MNADPLAALPFALPPVQRIALEQAYATPVRAYHNWQHVGDVLRHYAEVATGPGWSQPIEAAFAVLYHDAIYVAGVKDNEIRSADLAREHLAHWWPAVDADRVVQMIELTARHGALSPADVDDEDTRLFLDCDMAILGADPAAFDVYDHGIAAEYRSVVPGWLFRVQRRRFLKGLLARERIYLSDFFHARLDVQARNNLRRAVTTKR